jgi:hypothetical protein
MEGKTTARGFAPGMPRCVHALSMCVCACVQACGDSPQVDAPTWVPEFSHFAATDMCKHTGTRVLAVDSPALLHPSPSTFVSVSSDVSVLPRHCTRAWQRRYATVRHKSAPYARTNILTRLRRPAFTAVLVSAQTCACGPRG